MGEASIERGGARRQLQVGCEPSRRIRVADDSKRREPSQAQVLAGDDGISMSVCGARFALDAGQVLACTSIDPHGITFGHEQRHLQL